MDLIEKIYKLHKESKKKRELERIQVRKKFDSMSLSELNAYEQLVERKDSSNLLVGIVTFPFYITFYLGIFGLVMKYAFNIDLLILFKEISLTLLGFVPNLITIWLLVVIIYNFLNAVNLNKYKKRLLLKK
jgi:hypothetical protein